MMMAERLSKCISKRCQKIAMDDNEQQSICHGVAFASLMCAMLLSGCDSHGATSKCNNDDSITCKSITHHFNMTASTSKICSAIQKRKRKM